MIEDIATSPERNERARPVLIDENLAQQQITVCGKRFVADQTGALYWPAERALIIADMHLEKGSAAAKSGSLLPPYDTRATLLRLAEAIDTYDPDRVFALGDSFHDADAVSRMAADDLAALSIMQEGREWLWVAGNHDPHVIEGLGGTSLPRLRLGGLLLQHQPFAGPATHEIAGHLHPAARLSMHGYAIRRPCFVANGQRLVLPAFGSYAGGLNILDRAFEPLFGSSGLHVWMLGREGVYPVAARQLRGE
jgi:uncharacterized protein